MRRLLPFLALAACLAGPAALAGKFRRHISPQALTQAPPTLSTDGLSMLDVSGFRILLSAEQGQTLSGAGTLRAYLWAEHLGAWVRNPELDLTVSASGVRTQAFPDMQTLVPFGRVYFAADGVTVSGGTTVAVAVEAW